MILLDTPESWIFSVHGLGEHFRDFEVPAPASIPSLFVAQWILCHATVSNSVCQSGDATLPNIVVKETSAQCGSSHLFHSSPFFWRESSLIEQEVDRVLELENWSNTFTDEVGWNCIVRDHAQSLRQPLSTNLQQGFRMPQLCPLPTKTLPLCL
jgi:hypothetical protein